jgi:hypothetical protein
MGKNHETSEGSSKLGSSYHLWTQNGELNIIKPPKMLSPSPHPFLQIFMTICVD